MAYGIKTSRWTNADRLPFSPACGCGTVRYRTPNEAGPCRHQKRQPKLAKSHVQNVPSFPRKSGSHDCEAKEGAGVRGAAASRLRYGTVLGVRVLRCGTVRYGTVVRSGPGPAATLPEARQEPENLGKSHILHSTSGSALRYGRSQTRYRTVVPPEQRAKHGGKSS